MDPREPTGPLLDLFAVREIHLRGLLDLTDIAGAVALAQTPPGRRPGSRLLTPDPRAPTDLLPGALDLRKSP